MNSHSQGFEYEGLYGADFIEKAREKGDSDALEAIWRLQEATAARLVAEPLASLAVPRLSELLLEEALDANLGPQVDEDVRAAVRKHLPPLGPKGSERLAQWLRDNEPPAGVVSPPHEVLQIWLLQQEGGEADSFAREALTGDLGYEIGQDCRRAALERCRTDQSLAQLIVTKLEAALAEEGDSDVWELAAAFVEAMATDRRPPEYLESLTDRLVATAAEFAEVDEFSENLRRALIALSAPALKKLLAAEALANSSGSRALVRLHADLRRPQERAKAFVDVLYTQPRVWLAVSATVNQLWDAEEWDRRLSAVQRSDRAFEEELLVELMNAAPPERAGLVAQVAVERADGTDDSLVAAAGAKLEKFVSSKEPSDEESGGEEQPIEIPWWPSGQPPSCLAIFDAVLRNGIPDPDDRLPHVSSALQESRLSPAEAAHLIKPEEFAPLLSLLISGDLRRALAAELAPKDEDVLIEAVHQIHSGQGFQLDLAEAVASFSARTAFLGAQDAYADLPRDGRGRLVTLLEGYGGPEEISILDRVVQDTRAANAEYRRRAALRIGEITPEGQTLPDSLIELLRSNRPELVDTGAAVIGQIKPEETSLVRLLRSVAIDSEEGSEARVALRSLAETFVGRVSPDLPKEERVRILNLLAAAATPAVVDPLLSHVGRDALDDDPEVRRVAAAGLKEVASQGSLDTNELARLVKVIEEERDPTAKDDLQAAVTRASLGEDAALDVLQELLTFSPKDELSDLLGAEKNRVVRHLQLLATERERGEQGRPGVIMQLDIVAERILRVAYIKVGQSASLKSQIEASPRTPDYGALIQALPGVRQLERIQGQLQTLHVLRSTKTEFTHTGDQPTEEEEATAWTCFTEGVKVMVGVLDQA